MPIEMAFADVLRYLRNHSNDPRYLLPDDGYFDLLDDAFCSIDARKAAGYAKHIYTELALAHAPAPAF